jgi:hypothetical protein
MAGVQLQPQAAELALATFWKQLAAVPELSRQGDCELLQVGEGACFPLEGSNVANKLLVRQSYKDLHTLMLEHFDAGGRSFIITGNPGDLICAAMFAA